MHMTARERHTNHSHTHNQFLLPADNFWSSDCVCALCMHVFSCFWVHPAKLPASVAEQSICVVHVNSKNNNEQLDYFANARERRTWAVEHRCCSGVWRAIAVIIVYSVRARYVPFAPFLFFVVAFFLRAYLIIQRKIRNKNNNEKLHFAQKLKVAEFTSSEIFIKWYVYIDSTRKNGIA